MANLKVVHLDLEDPTALHRHYDAELQAQPCHVSLDLEDGQLTADYNAEIGSAVPESVWHGRTLWWDVPCLTAVGFNELLNDLMPLAERVLAGATVTWDGSNSVGRLDTDAVAASDEIGETLGGLSSHDYPHVIEWDAADWFAQGDRPQVAPEASDADLDQLGEALTEEACQAGIGEHPDDVVVLHGLDDWLHAARDEAREQAESELADIVEELEVVEERRDQAILRCSNWLSLRAVGELAGLSHTQIRRITSSTETGTFRAYVGTSATMADPASTVWDVRVREIDSDGRRGDEVLLAYTDTPVHVPGNTADALASAGEVLRANGWEITGQWRHGPGGSFATVKRS